MNTIDSPLLHHSFFAGMSEKHVAEIAQLATPVHLPENHFIFHKGDSASWFFLIVDGQVAIETEARHRGKITVQTLKSDEALGWSWLFKPYVWHFDARTLRPTDALMIDADRLRQLCEHYP